MKAIHSIQEVTSRQHLRDFLDVPRRVYREDPIHVLPLDLEQQDLFNRRNPYFEHAEAALWVAYDADGEPIGRISAQIDQLAQTEEPSDGLHGHFGFLEAIHSRALTALLKQAEAWLERKGATRVSGPYSFSINMEAGLLIAGYDSPPAYLMNHAPPWYADTLGESGYVKARDLLAFHFDPFREPPPTPLLMARKAEHLPSLVERPLNKKQYAAEIRKVVAIFNDAWSRNWGFVPMTENEIAHMAKLLKPVVEPDLVRLIEIEGQPTAMLLALPDLNEAFVGLDGRLLPLGWARLLWRLKISGLSRARVMLMGVSREWDRDMRGAAMAALLMVRLNDALRRKRFRQLELSWILEDNGPMIRLAHLIGGEPSKRYRIYQKTLA